MVHLDSLGETNTVRSGDFGKVCGLALKDLNVVVH